MEKRGCRPECPAAVGSSCRNRPHRGIGPVPGAPAIPSAVNGQGGGTLPIDLHAQAPKTFDGMETILTGQKIFDPGRPFGDGPEHHRPVGNRLVPRNPKHFVEGFSSCRLSASAPFPFLIACEINAFWPSGSCWSHSAQISIEAAGLSGTITGNDRGAADSGSRIFQSKENTR